MSRSTDTAFKKCRKFATQDLTYSLNLRLRKEQTLHQYQANPFRIDRKSVRPSALIPIVTSSTIDKKLEITKKKHSKMNSKLTNNLKYRLEIFEFLVEVFLTVSILFSCFVSMVDELNTSMEI